MKRPYAWLAPGFLVLILLAVFLFRTAAQVPEPAPDPQKVPVIDLLKPGPPHRTADTKRWEKLAESIRNSKTSKTRMPARSRVK